jgi:hypothetical protein
MRFILLALLIVVVGASVYKYRHFSDGSLSPDGMWVFLPDVTCINGKPDSDTNGLESVGVDACRNIKLSYVGTYRCRKSVDLRHDGQEILQVQCK